MPPEQSNTPTTEPTAGIPLLTNFCTDDADVIIRAAGTIDFLVHKFILSLVSPFFKDMFTLPQPPSDTPEMLPHVDVQESPKTWENILRTIYPTIQNPTINTLDDLQSLLFAAQAYEMQSVIEAHKNTLVNRAFVEGDPLHLFSIACVCGFEDLATYVARNAELLVISRSFCSGAPKGLTLDAYGRLVSFLVERDNAWQRILRDTVIPPPSVYCNCAEPRGRLYDVIKMDLHKHCLQTEEIYTKALEHRSNFSSKCSPGPCPIGNREIKKFIEGMIKEREKVYNKFQPTKWY